MDQRIRDGLNVHKCDLRDVTEGCSCGEAAEVERGEAFETWVSEDITQVVDAVLGQLGVWNRNREPRSVDKKNGER